MKAKAIPAILISALLLSSCSKEERIQDTAEYDLYLRDNCLYLEIHDNGAFDVFIPIYNEDGTQMTLDEYNEIIKR